MSHEKALEAAYAAACDKMIGPNPHRDEITAAIDAYLSALVPDEAAGVVERLRAVVPITKPFDPDDGMISWNWAVSVMSEVASLLTALAARAEKAAEAEAWERRAGEAIMCEAAAVERITTLEAENAALRARLEKAGRCEPLAYLVHNMMPPKMPVQARGKFLEPDHFLYPATRENDAREMAKIMRGDLTPLYAKELG